MGRILIDIIDGIYIIALIGLAVYGVNNIISVILYLRVKDQSRRRHRKIDNALLPRVTVQLPTYNERYIVTRLIDAVVKFDYPRERLQIQVLDDSTDDTTDLIRRLVKKYSAQGLDISLVRRTDRSGFKAGALSEGLKTATGELVAIFDADFVPQPDWLMKTVPEFWQQPRLGCLQTRWGHLNDRYNTITLAQSLGIDGHFIIEQTARSRHGLFMNFNGTAGIWRKACIEDAGGWQSDTLTEDLDLSYRAQLRGWRIDYLPGVVVPAELPAQIEAFKKQQFRWAKGSFQTLKKLIPSVFKSDAPWYKKLLGLLHMSGYFVHPLMLVVAILILPVGIFNPQVFKWLPWTMLAAFGPPMLYLVSATEHMPRWTERLKLLPVLTMIGFGLSLNNTVAFIEGIFGKGRGTFTRTPKFNLKGQNGNWNGSNYVEPLSPMVWGEIGLGFYCLLTGIALGFSYGWQVVPWVMIYAAGYFYVAGLNLFQTEQLARPHTRVRVPVRTGR